MRNFQQNESSTIKMWVFNHQNMGIEPTYGGLTNGPKETMDLPGTAVSTATCPSISGK